MDTVDRQTRSRIMAAIKSRWTGPERRAHGILKSRHVPHRMHGADLPGSPDIVLKGRRVAIFIDGCFWHGHGHCRVPDSPFWREKIWRNRARDRRDRRRLRAMGYKVFRIWECRLSSARLLAAAGAR